MSAQPVNLHLGPGELFLRRYGEVSSKFVRVGSVRGQAVLTYTPTFVESMPGNSITPVRRDKTSEKTTFKVTIVDFKISQLIAAFGQTLSTTQITVTSTLRIFQEIAFGSLTTSKTLLKNPVSLTSVIVTSLDQSTKYARGTDYTGTISKIKPKVTTFAHGSRLVAYDTKDASATVIKVGDSLNLQVVELKYSSRMQNGKFITLQIYRATIGGGLTIPFSMETYTTYDITFEALGDSTKPSANNMFKIIKQA